MRADSHPPEAPTGATATRWDGRGSARERLNLIEEITAAAVASDYGPVQDGPRPSQPRQRALVSAVAVGVAGLIIAMGVSARIINAPIVGEQREALRARIAQADEQGDSLAEQVTALRQQLQVARAEDLDASQTGRALAVDVARYELVTGYTAVTGPGAVVTLSDAAVPDEDDPALSRVLDSDVQSAVNGLWQAGAEAVAVNGQRITARTAIRSAAGAILVNYRPLTPPYQISAIGPPELSDDFDATASAEDLRSVSRRFGIGFVTESADALALPAATTALPDQATVVEDTEGTTTP